MRVLLACLRSDFGEDGIQKFNEQGEFINPSWEYMNFYLAWKQLADEGLIDLEVFWTDEQNNKERERLVSLAKDASFVYQCPVTHALGIHLPQARQIIDGGTPIVSFHPDLHMRYKHPAGDKFVLSRVTEGYDTHTISPALHMMDQLKNDGVKAYHMPFGIPSWCDRELGAEKLYDVSFVGQNHGIRGQVVSQLRAAGVNVQIGGYFWGPGEANLGRPTCLQMVRIFNQSKVNLNLRWCSRSPHHGQIKGRDLEILGCGAFMVASRHDETDDFHQLYFPKHEYAEYTYVHELIDGIKYWLENDTDRNAVAYNAYQKREANLWITRLRKFLEDWETW